MNGTGSRSKSTAGPPCPSPAPVLHSRHLACQHLMQFTMCRVHSSLQPHTSPQVSHTSSSMCRPHGWNWHKHRTHSRPSESRLLHSSKPACQPLRQRTICTAYRSSSPYASPQVSSKVQQHVLLTVVALAHTLNPQQTLLKTLRQRYVNARTSGSPT